jgi:hypothetical protein
MVPKHKTLPPLVEEGGWDGDAARERMKEWATGPDGEIDWNKYAQGFAFVVEENRDTLGAYKLPHHDIVKGQFITSVEGVIAAIAAMHGARGGVDVGNYRAEVYKHLEEHVRQDITKFGLKSEDEVPEYVWGKELNLRKEVVDEMEEELEEVKVEGEEETEKGEPLIELSLGGVDIDEDEIVIKIAKDTIEEFVKAYIEGYFAIYGDSIFKSIGDRIEKQVMEWREEKGREMIKEIVKELVEEEVGSIIEGLEDRVERVEKLVGETEKGLRVKGKVMSVDKWGRGEEEPKRVTMDEFVKDLKAKGKKEDEIVEEVIKAIREGRIIRKQI